MRILVLSGRRQHIHILAQLEDTRALATQALRDGVGRGACGGLVRVLGRGQAKGADAERAHQPGGSEATASDLLVFLVSEVLVRKHAPLVGLELASVVHAQPLGVDGLQLGLERLEQCALLRRRDHVI